MLYLQYWDINNLYYWVMSQKLSLGNFKWDEETCESNEDFIKIYNDESDWYFPELDVEYPENLHNLDLPFLPHRMKF